MPSSANWPWSDGAGISRRQAVVVAPDAPPRAAVTGRHAFVADDRDAPIPAPSSLRRRAADIDWRSHVPFAVVVIVVTVLRGWILVHPAVPSGPDPGNWLAFGHSLIGHSVRGPSVTYPPAVPLVVLAATGLLGLTAGTAAVALAAALAPGVCVYLVLRRAGLGWKGAVPAGFLLVASSTGEAAAWGGYAQLLGIGLAVVLVWALDQFLRSRRTRHAAVVGALAFAELATSHLIAAVTVVVATALVGLHVLVRPAPGPGPSGDQRPWGDRLTPLALALAPCLLLAPLYAHLAGTVLRSFVDRPGADRLPTGSTFRTLRLVFGDAPDFWRNATILAVLTPVLLLRKRSTNLWMVTTSFVVGVGVAVLLGHERRLLYLVPVAVVLTLGCWLDELGTVADLVVRHFGAAVLAVLLAVLVVETAHLPATFRAHRSFYAVLTPGLVQAIDWVHDHTPRSDVIAVGDVDGVPLGWWVEGLGERSTLLGSDARWLNFPDERARASAAADVFTVDFPSAATLAAARVHGARWVLIPLTGTGAERLRDRVASFLTAHPDLAAFENGDAAVLHVPQGL